MSRSGISNGLHQHLQPHLYVSFTLTALIAALIGGALVWFFCQGRAATFAERSRALTDENQRLVAELAALRAETQRLSTLVTQHATELTAERAAHDPRIAAHARNARIALEGSPC